MTINLLWFNDDSTQLSPYRGFLKDNHCEIREVFNVTEAEDALFQTKQRYDLLVLDVMIPVGERERVNYPSEQDRNGLRTGLYFLKRWRQYASEHNLRVSVLVLTHLNDEEIRNDFAEEGITRNCRESFSRVRGPAELLEKIKRASMQCCLPPVGG